MFTCGLFVSLYLQSSVNSILYVYCILSVYMHPLYIRIGQKPLKNGGLLYVLEELPGYIQWEDLSHVLAVCMYVVCCECLYICVCIYDCVYVACVYVIYTYVVLNNT